MCYFKLLIIGAGASGVAAASKLLESGFGDFRVLEAENRIGGRINTSCIGNTPIEIGAEWIHGIGNVVYELAAKNNLVDDTVSPLIDIDLLNDANFYEYTGQQVNKDVSRALAKIYNDIIDKDVFDLKGDLNVSVGQFFDTKFWEGIEYLRKKINVSDDLCRKFLRLFENWENSIDASHSWYETSLIGLREYWECEGNNVIHWKNRRYNTIFKLLSKEIPNESEKLPIDEKIIFNKEVIKVKWNKEGKLQVPNVEVECLDGTVYKADYLLITCSIGVLKERASQMFMPLLPKKKLETIQYLGFGTVNKIFLKFDHRWWSDFNGFFFLWSDEEIKCNNNDWIHGVICFHPVDQECSILRGWITGEAARRMETLSNSELIEGFNLLLNKFLGSSHSIPPIEICLTSKWYSNPHFRGSYSCRLMETENEDVWAYHLAEPVCNNKGKPILLFGGEATHSHYYSTVHGAIEAGQREADRLLESLRYVPNYFRYKPEIKSHYEVVIVGAGISGLAAAKTLIDGGVSDLIILEAQSVPGGRIRSLKVGEYTLEIGAQWIHGEQNEVFTFCKENDLLTSESTTEAEGLYLRENGERIDDEIVNEVSYVVEDILEKCDSYAYSQSENVPQSIGQELIDKFDEYLESCSEDSEEVKIIKRELLDWQIRFQVIDNSCSDLHKLSAKGWGLFTDCGGNNYVSLKNGYSSLIDSLINNLPENLITYNTSVQCIDWLEKLEVKEKNNQANKSTYVEPNYGAKITCSNDVTVFSQYVIVTSSLGYLKSNYKTMFRPSLPSSLTRAIENLGFDGIGKIFLIYKKPWWKADDKGFQLVWHVTKTSQKNHWGKYVTGFDVIRKNQPVLLGWVGGEGAKIVEQLSDDQVGQEATELLRKFNKNPDIPLPEKVIRSSWCSNEYVKGAYSHIAVDCDENGINCSDLAQPIYSTICTPEGSFKKPTILFAGESTHKNHYSTVHGAYESGQDQAKVILDQIKVQSLKPL